MRKALALLLFFVFSASLSGQDLYDLAIEEAMLPNGLRVLVLERPGDDRVACKIFTDMGAMNEVPGQLGAAHFLEHLMFKGTKTLGTTDWAAEEPLRDRLAQMESKLVEALNAQRNETRRRGVFDSDVVDQEETEEIFELRARIADLEYQMRTYRLNGEMMKWYQANGGVRLTATTEQEYMKFDINLPVERLELFMRVEADRMVNSIFREFDEERMILVEQRYGDLNRPLTPYAEAMNSLVSQIHPVFWPEGYPTDFYAYTRAYERELYEEYFIPNNTTLVFVGGVSMQDVQPLADQYFGWMERKPEPRRVEAVEPPPVGERQLTWRSDDLAPRVEHRFMIPGVGHPDRPAFELIAELASMELERAAAQTGMSISAEVDTRVVHESRFGVPGSINIAAVLTNERDIDRADTILRQVLAGLATGSVDEGNLSLARKRLRTDWIRTISDADQLGFDIGHFQVMDSWKTLGPYMRSRETASMDDVARIAKQYFVDANRSVGIVRPESP